jgi:hypothetical protein
MGVTLKDVPAKEFIEAFAKHLKKGNKIKMPEVSARLCLSGVFAKLQCFDAYFIFLFSINSNK